MSTMDLLSYHKRRRAIQLSAYPGSNREVKTMESTLRSLLMATGLFEEVEVERTDDPDQLVIAMCKFSPNYSESDVAGAIERLWRDRVRYPFWEAHGLVVHDEFVEFEAATRTSTTGHYVTVHMVAEAAGIPRQRVSRD